MGNLFDRLFKYHILLAAMKYNPLQDIPSEEKVEEPPINENFKDISLGDIIIATRYKNDEEKAAMPYGHKSGPFLVIENNGNTLKAIYGTSNKHILNDSSLMKNFTIDSEHLSKETVFVLTNAETIDDYRYKTKAGSLTVEELSHLTNKLLGLKEELTLSENMIVKYEDQYYFVKELNDTYATLIYLVKNGKKNLVTINGITYEVLLNRPEYVFNLDKLHIIDIVSDRVSKLINKKYEEATKEESVMQVATRGNLINFNGNLFYVNGVTGQILNCFRVKNMATKAHRITINGAPYEACFDDTKDINSKALYDICLKATDKEMDAIKEVKKQYTYEQKHSVPKQPDRKKMKNKIIKPGTIVFEKRPLDKDYYVVLRRNTNTLYVINIKDAERNLYDRVINMDVRQVEYLGTYDEYEYYKLCTEVNKIDNIAVTDGYLLQLKKQDA